MVVGVDGGRDEPGRDGVGACDEEHGGLEEVELEPARYEAGGVCRGWDEHFAVKMATLGWLCEFVL